MYCKNCESKTEVTHTRNSDDENVTYRRRKCLKCGLFFTTEEHIKCNTNPVSQAAVHT